MPDYAHGEHDVYTRDHHGYKEQPLGSHNGVRVFLSSPRHSNSGSKGECRPGWDENINGRYTGFSASTTNYYKEAYDPESEGRNLPARHYKTMVSANWRDDNFINSVDKSNNWGAQIHLVTHTNGISACPESNQQLLLLYDSSYPAETVHVLRDELKRLVDQVAPGNSALQNRAASGLRLYELRGSVKAPYRSYVELLWHTNPESQKWMTDRFRWNKSTWRYGLAVDKHMKYPR